MEMCKYVVDADIYNHELMCFGEFGVTECKNNPKFKCVVYCVGDKGVARIYETDDSGRVGEYYWASYVFDAENEAKPSKWTPVTSSGGYDSLNLSFVYDKDGKPITTRWENDTLVWKKVVNNEITVQCVPYYAPAKNNQTTGSCKLESVPLLQISYLVFYTSGFADRSYKRALQMAQDVDLYYRNQIQKDPDWLNKIKQRKCPDLWLIGRTQKQKG